MSERGSAHTSERENNSWISSFLSLGFTVAIGAHSISEEVVGFILYGLPKDNYLCLLSRVIIDVHVILESDKILRSYCLNDKNITWYQS